MSGASLPHPDTVIPDLERAAEGLIEMSKEWRDIYFLAHDRPYRNPGRNTEGARSPKGSHSDETGDIALSQDRLRARLRSIAARLYGRQGNARSKGDGLLTKISKLHTDLAMLSESEDDFDVPLRSIETPQRAGEMDRLLAAAYREDRELQGKSDRLETERRTLQKRIAQLERTKSREERALPGRRWSA